MQARLQSNGMMSRQERALPLMHEHSEQIAANRHRKSQNEWCDNGATTAKTIVNIPMLSGNRLFWTDDGNKPVISDSALRLVQSKKRSLNWERIAMELVPSSPTAFKEMLPSGRGYIPCRCQRHCTSMGVNNLDTHHQIRCRTFIIRNKSSCQH